MATGAHRDSGQMAVLPGFLPQDMHGIHCASSIIISVFIRIL